MNDEFDSYFDIKKTEETKPFIEPEQKQEGTDPSSPEEQARRFEEVLKDPPVKGYGKVELYSAKDESGNDYIAMPHENGELDAQFQNGEKVKITLYDPLFEIDLYDLLKGQIAEAPINVIPNLIDEKCQIVANEQKDWKPEKPKRDWTRWYWAIVAVSFVPMILVGVAMFAGYW